MAQDLFGSLSEAQFRMRASRYGNGVCSSAPWSAALLLLLLPSLPDQVFAGDDWNSADGTVTSSGADSSKRQSGDLLDAKVGRHCGKSLEDPNRKME